MEGFMPIPSGSRKSLISEKSRSSSAVSGFDAKLPAVCTRAVRSISIAAAEKKRRPSFHICFMLCLELVNQRVDLVQRCDWKLRLTVVCEQAVNLLFDIGELRVTESGKTRHSGNGRV